MEQERTMQQTVLVLGATGRFGRNAAKAFQDAGWHVRRFDRSRDRLEEAVRGVDVIVNGFNPVYPDWARDLPRLTREVIGAARMSGASVIVPGNVYVFGESTPPPWSAESPHRAQNSLGRLRREMEETYAASGVRTILIRAGDFIDTEASGNWFDSDLPPEISRTLM
jgi:nucleoside-diphosphate-sugar epimerase